MHILALETTDRAGSVAALVGNQLVATAELEASLRSAQSLAPGIQSILNQAQWKPSDVQLVAVAAGPGSFTGLRIGVTTAKLFAYAVGAQVLGVNTLEVIASQIPPNVFKFWAVLDAQREQVFAGQFVRTGSSMQWQGETLLLDDEAWLTRLAQQDSVGGPGLVKLLDRIPSGVQLVDRALWSPTAASVGAAAWRQFEAGRRDDVWTFVPQYFRRSAAEEKRLAAAKTQ